MSATSQLQAHYAALQLDALLEHVVLAYVPTRDLVAAEWREKDTARDGDPTFDASANVRRRVRQVLRVRAAIVALADALVELRADLGTDKFDMPAGDPDVWAELARLQELERADAPPSTSPLEPVDVLREGDA